MLSTVLEARPPAPESDEFAEEWAREARELAERDEARRQERE